MPTINDIAALAALMGETNSPSADTLLDDIAAAMNAQSAVKDKEAADHMNELRKVARRTVKGIDPDILLEMAFVCGGSFMERVLKCRSADEAGAVASVIIGTEMDTATGLDAREEMLSGISSLIFMATMNLADRLEKLHPGKSAAEIAKTEPTDYHHIVEASDKAIRELARTAMKRAGVEVKK